MKALCAVLLSAAACGGVAGEGGASDAGRPVHEAASPDETGPRRADAKPRDGAVDVSLLEDAPALDGESGLSCSSDAGDAGGALTIASFDWVPNSLAVSSAGVYWTIEGRAFMKSGPLPTGSVESAAPDGCPATTLATGQIPTAIALGASAVYWTDSAEPGGPGGSVLSVPVGGGTVTTITTGQTNPMDLAVDGTNVYWANYGDYEEAYNGSIVAAPLSGGAATTLATKRNDPTSIAVDATYVYWTDFGENAWSNGKVLRVPKTGGAVVTLAGKRNDPGAIALAAGTVYFLDTKGLESVPEGGGAVTTVLAGGVWSYAIDGGILYWLASPGTLMTRPLTGGAVTTLATTMTFSGSIAVGESYVYWTEFSGTSGGSIRRVAK